ncbi:hypothetical protein [Mesorhizobium sp. 43Arga]
MRKASCATGFAHALVTSFFDHPKIDEDKRIMLRHIQQMDECFDRLEEDLLDFQKTYFTEQMMDTGRAMPTYVHPTEQPGAQVSADGVRDFENEVRTPPASKLSRIRRALEDAGVMFIALSDQVGQGPAVRLKTAAPALSTPAEGEAGEPSA